MDFNIDFSAASLSARARTVLTCLVLLTVVAMETMAYGQQTSEAPSATANETLHAPVPLVDVATESEAAAETIRDMQTDLSSDQSAAVVAQQLPLMTREIDGRLRESRKIVAQSPSIEMLGGLEGEWRRLRRELYGLNRNLSNRVHELERYIGQLDGLAKTWDETFAAAKESNAPPEVLGRVENIVQQIREARDAVEKQRGRVLIMQTRVGLQDSRAANALMSIDQARESALDRLFS